MPLIPFTTPHNRGLRISALCGELQKAEFEGNVIRKRTLAGLKAARARGRVGGRPEKLSLRDKQIAGLTEAEGRVARSKLVDASLLRMLDRDRQRFQLHALLREELRNLAPLGELQAAHAAAMERLLEERSLRLVGALVDENRAGDR